jgi:hypothetical protein
MKHSFFPSRFFSIPAYAGLICALALTPALGQARGQAAPQPPLAPRLAPHPKPPLPARLRPGHTPPHHHPVQRGPVKLDVEKYPSKPQQTIQGFRQN